MVSCSIYVQICDYLLYCKKGDDPLFCDILNNISPIPRGYIIAEPNEHDDDSFGRRRVEYYEIEYIHEGTGYVWVDGVKVPTLPHSIHFRRPGMEVEGIGRYHSHYIEFYFNQQHDIVEELDSMPLLYQIQDYLEVEKIFELLFQEYYKDSLTRKLSFKIQVLRLFEMMINDWYEHTRSDHLNAEASDSLQRSIRFIQEHFAEPLTVPELAGLAGYSVYHYTRIFKEYTHWTPIQFLNRCRITYAKTLLAEENLSTEETLYRCGFNNYSYFFRIFKEQCDLTPSQYKRKHRYKASSKVSE